MTPDSPSSSSTSSPAATLDTAAVSPALGVEVRGLDLREPLSDAQQRALRALLDEHYLLLFRDQQLTVDDHIRVMGTFGDVSDEYGDGQKSFYISNTHEDGALGEEELAYHSDWSWAPVPVFVLSLYAEELVGATPPTRFVGAATAYTQISDELRQQIEGREALHVNYQPWLMTEGYATRQRLVDLPSDADETNAPRLTHPVVRPHPRTGAPIVFVNPFFTSHIVDMPLAESDALLDELFDCIREPENTYVHEWQLGDLVVWDNIALLHARSSFKGIGARRTLRRVSTSPDGKSPRASAGLSSQRVRPITA